MSHNMKLKIAGIKMKYWHGVKYVLANSFPNAKGWLDKALDNAYERAYAKHHQSTVEYFHILFGHKV